MYSGTMLGMICVAALLGASVFLALLDRKEKKKGHLEKSKFLSKVAITLFIAAFAGGAALALLGAVAPKQAIEDVAGSDMSTFHMDVPGAATEVDQAELAKLEEKIQKDASDVKSRERLGHLYLQMQKFDKVFEMSHEVLKLDPKSVESRVHMATVLSGMGQFEPAMAQFQRALDVEPNNAEALLFKGMIQMQSGDAAGAQKTWEHFMKVAKKNDPSRARVEMFLGMANGKMKEGK